MTTKDASRPDVACAMTIFGAAGDLTKRKLIPAIYHLAVDGLLPKHFALVGIARADMTNETFRKQIDSEIRSFLTDELKDEVWKDVLPRLHYVRGEFNDEGTYARLKAQLEIVDKEFGAGGNYLHYLSTPPSFFFECTKRLAAAGLTQETDGRWRRVIVEKPFGRDLESARTLNHDLQQVLAERQIYRIDHYLGKETVQNLLVFRFANGLFEPIWNHRYIDHIQITAAEKVGAEGRGTYYEEAGALRDMVSNHLLQLVALTAMEPPVSFDADSVRDEKAKALRAIRPFSNEDVLTNAIRGQYGPGVVGGERVPGYRQEEKVSPQSRIETFVALRLQIDNWRWAGVPFYVRTGKRLAARRTEIAIRFKSVPHVLFRDLSGEGLPSNELVIRIQPDEGISLKFGAKQPGAVMRIGEVLMDFKYAGRFTATPSTGYETLLHDAIHGDATLYQRADNVEASWAALGPILDVWAALNPRDFPDYAAGSWGPIDSDQLLSRDGRAWRNAL
jgi:glucose-6-phosphate 1-dehydrogenase